MAEVDLVALGEQIAATAAAARADDPAALRARVRELEAELAAERAKPAPEPERVVIEVPVLDEALLAQIEAALTPASALLAEARDTLAKHRAWASDQDQPGRQPPDPPPTPAPIPDADPVPAPERRVPSPRTGPGRR